jgi:hypothetical protein
MTELATFMYQVANALRQKRTAKILGNLNLLRPTPDIIVEKIQNNLFERIHSVNDDTEYRNQYRQTRQYNPLDKALAVLADAIDDAADKLPIDKPVAKSKRRFTYAKADDVFMHLFSLLNRNANDFLAQMGDIQTPSSVNYQHGWYCFEVKLAIEELCRYMEAIHVLQYEQTSTPAYEQFVTFIFDFVTDKRPTQIFPYDLLYSAKLEASGGTTRWLTRPDSVSIYPTDYAEKYGLKPDDAVIFEPNIQYKKAA